MESDVSKFYLPPTISRTKISALLENPESILVKHVRLLILNQRILSKLAHNPLVPDYIKMKYKKAQGPSEDN